MQRRYVPRSYTIIVVLLPLILTSVNGDSWAQSVADRFFSSGGNSPDTPPASVDFDGDNVADLLTLDRTSGQGHLEIQLGRTHEVSSLFVNATLVHTGKTTRR